MPSKITMLKKIARLQGRKVVLMCEGFTVTGTPTEVGIDYVELAGASILNEQFAGSKSGSVDGQLMVFAGELRMVQVP